MTISTGMAAAQVWTQYNSAALEASKVVKASAGRLRSLAVVNTHTAALYLQIFNSASVPADATVPAFSHWVDTGKDLAIDFGAHGRVFSTGISVCLSSTQGTKTVGGSVALFQAEYL